jgi:circadian clock protein KaiC
VKVRASNHSKEIRFFDIANDGIKIGKALTNYHGILSGEPTLRDESDPKTPA